MLRIKAEFESIILVFVSFSCNMDGNGSFSDRFSLFALKLFFVTLEVTFLGNIPSLLIILLAIVPLDDDDEGVK